MFPCGDPHSSAQTPPESEQFTFSRGAPASFTFHKIITTRATVERVLSHLNYGSQDFYSSIYLASVFPLPLPFLSLSLSVTEAMSNTWTSDSRTTWMPCVHNSLEKWMLIQSVQLIAPFYQHSSIALALCVPLSVLATPGSIFATCGIWKWKILRWKPRSDCWKTTKNFTAAGPGGLINEGLLQPSNNQTASARGVLKKTNIFTSHIIFNLTK